MIPEEPTHEPRQTMANDCAPLLYPQHLRNGRI